LAAIGKAIGIMPKCHRYFWQSGFPLIFLSSLGIFDEVNFEKVIFDKVIFDKVIFDKVIFDVVSDSLT